MSELENLRSRQKAWLCAVVSPVLVIVISFVFRNIPVVKAATVCNFLVLLMVGVAAITDIHWRKIPNWVTYPGLFWALAINAYASCLASQDTINRLGAVGLVDSVVGASVLFVAMLLVYAFGGRGAGDVKLLTSVGGFLGLSGGIEATILSIVVGGGVVFAWSIFRHGPVFVIGTLCRALGSWICPIFVIKPVDSQLLLLNRRCPLGPFIAVGTLLVLADLSLEELLRRISTPLFGR